jgi:hypothetical protein
MEEKHIVRDTNVEESRTHRGGVNCNNGWRETTAPGYSARLAKLVVEGVAYGATARGDTQFAVDGGQVGIDRSGGDV